ncbi:hypothetical protein COS55_00835 [Candidatus Shapirobacteria bacterium CG03_land_8_20_14_0_80_40_19]|uniref:phosphoribosylglycinamide formyltransferase 1 n=4 Tax=Candidatus Shapironibacteriota TaxID=1752721 RepID=A0A2M7BFQ2_9BACT|nr:MAG: hypothetical protein COV89_03120 [Candidatus Shapirobacteria bacterium CG11_big_fil_rev_8_21_14_0_20_40_12]PIV01917.1 MAG: hypothetical protein COS55_00835 [Candidatus Shapirobacteria bacterium CG03_land_8_20_14_0_80_40_19]PJC29154.1 MAG: hypothetical protein CO053_00780 [Candidatus Shapirobacteria bacterium CG_4_9_14_0_2_um_filter_40_11]PJC76798.1 MAG: hypothetical protein CO010_01760 [Candidatus Shapirobacteria bacterium CG_4_8_14_3_um_filter_39_11]
MKERLASLISGGGTTMQAVVEACQSGEVPMEVACVVSSNSSAGGMEKAKKLGIPDEDIIVVDPDTFRGSDGKIDQNGFGQAILRELRQRGTTVITQNGWLPLTPGIVIDEFPGMIFNQHPGSKKETRATHGIQPHAIMLYIARQTGRNLGTEVIIHRVNEKWDNGPTVAVARVPIDDVNEDPKILQTRALPVEHALQITFLKQLARGIVQEIFTETEYLRPGEEHILFEARKYAREFYPNG